MITSEQLEIDTLLMYTGHGFCCGCRIIRESDGRMLCPENYDDIPSDKMECPKIILLLNHSGLRECLYCKCSEPERYHEYFWISCEVRTCKNYKKTEAL